MAGLNEFHEFLVAVGGEIEQLSRHERRRVEIHWRETFAKDLLRSQIGKFDWHIFHRGLFPSLHGHKALATYLACSEREVIVRPESWNTPAFAYRGPLPILTEVQNFDVHVFPVSADWTMVFTHEDGAMASGPFFATRNVNR